MKLPFRGSAVDELCEPDFQLSSPLGKQCWKLMEFLETAHVLVEKLAYILRCGT